MLSLHGNGKIHIQVGVSCAIQKKSRIGFGAAQNGLFGDDVDDTTHGIGAEQYAHRAFDDFYLFDLVCGNLGDVDIAIQSPGHRRTVDQYFDRLSAQALQRDAGTELGILTN